eukprot:gene16586-18273_t
MGLNLSSKRPNLKTPLSRAVHVNVGMVGRDSYGELKPLRGKRLPVKEVITVPGNDELPFKLNVYKEELGRPYSQLNFYLCPLAVFEPASAEVTEVTTIVDSDSDHAEGGNAHSKDCDSFTEEIFNFPPAFETLFSSDPCHSTETLSKEDDPPPQFEGAMSVMFSSSNVEDKPKKEDEIHLTYSEKMGTLSSAFSRESEDRETVVLAVKEDECGKMRRKNLLGYSGMGQANKSAIYWRGRHIPDFEIQSKLNQIKVAATEEEFNEKIDSFPERFSAGVMNPSIRHKDKPQIFFQFFATINYTCDADKNEMREKEEDVYFKPHSFLEGLQYDSQEKRQTIELEDEAEIHVERCVSLADVLKFCSGSKYITKDMVGKGSISFIHPKPEQYGMGIMANTCSLVLTLPVISTIFCNTRGIHDSFVEDICSAPDFGMI